MLVGRIGDWFLELLKQIQLLRKFIVDAVWIFILQFLPFKSF